MAASRFGAFRSAAGKADKTAAKAGSKAASKAPDEKPGRLKTFWQIFTITRESDRLLPLWMALAFAGTVLVVLLFGLLVHAWLPIVVVFGVVARRHGRPRRHVPAGQRFAYERAAGQPGVSGQVMKNIRRGTWYVEEEPVAIDPRTRDLVFRAVGRPGVVLVAEGPVGRTDRLVEGERKRVARVVGPNVPVTVLHVGDGEGQVPLRRLESKMTRMRPTLSKGEVSAVAARLKALGGARPPIPKGIDPTRMRPDRKGVRGR